LQVTIIYITNVYFIANPQYIKHRFNFKPSKIKKKATSNLGNSGKALIFYQQPKYSMNGALNVMEANQRRTLSMNCKSNKPKKLIFLKTSFFNALSVVILIERLLQNTFVFPSIFQQFGGG
jgi:hypothetical protein